MVSQKSDCQKRNYNIRHHFVRRVYANQNESYRVKRAFKKCVSRLKDSDLGLNVGAGATDLHPRILNLDLISGRNIDCVARAESLPFSSNSMAVIISQETLEHVNDPEKACLEMFRVLKNGGTLYCQLPFIIGYHPGPKDYWRFSKEGIRELVERCGFLCEEIGMAVGPATGFYRIAVEFLAIFISRIYSGFYHPVKALTALLLFPLKWFDYLLLSSSQADRIAGGYYVIARKDI